MTGYVVLTYARLEATLLPLTKAPETKLLEYYRLLRVSNVHLKDGTQSRAGRAYNSFNDRQIEYFRKNYDLAAPDAPHQVNFSDFLLFTRAIKYYSRLVNEACA